MGTATAWGTRGNLGYSHIAVEVGVITIGQNLRQARGQVKGVVRGLTVDGLADAVAQAVVGEGVGVRALGEGFQAVGIENVAFAYELVKVQNYCDVICPIIGRQITACYRLNKQTDNWNHYLHKNRNDFLPHFGG